VPETVLDQLVDSLTICTPLRRLDAAIGKIERLRASGLGGVALRLYADPAASIRVIGERVAPALR
jgi:hypothetical protein